MQPADRIAQDPTTTRAPAPSAALPRLYRGRPWLAAVIAALVELVVIGGVDNQAVTRVLRKPIDDPARVVADYSRGAIDAATAFWWRFAPADGQATHVWAAQFAAIAVLVLLTWLGTLAVARGSVSFGRVWVGVWAVVAASAPIAVMVRNALVTPTAPGPAQSKIGQAIYGYDQFGSVLVAGLALGFVTGLVVAAVAVSSRRQIAAAAPVERGFAERDEYYDDSFAPRYGAPDQYEQQYAQPQQPQPWAESQWTTTQLPPVPEPVSPPPWPPTPPPAAWSPGPPGDGPVPAGAATAEMPPMPPPPEATGPGPEPSAAPGAAPVAEPSATTELPPEPEPQPQREPEPQPETGAGPEPAPPSDGEEAVAPAEQTQQLPRVPSEDEGR
jgi:hypothetical protein